MYVINRYPTKLVKGWFPVTGNILPKTDITSMSPHCLCKQGRGGPVGQGLLSGSCSLLVPGSKGLCPHTGWAPRRGPSGPCLVPPEARLPGLTTRGSRHAHKPWALEPGRVCAFSSPGFSICFSLCCVFTSHVPWTPEKPFFTPFNSSLLPAPK